MNEDLIKNLYLGHHKEKTLKHAEEVAETAVRLAEIHHLDPGKTRIAALLHDISAIMTPQEMYDIYMEKNKENFNRQLGLSKKEGYKAPEA